jgi:Spy/CpxP family protein refolding chaperone
MSEIKQSRPSSRRRWVIAAAIIGVATAVAGTASAAWAHKGWGHRGTMSTEMIEEHIERGVKYVLSDIDASKEQKAQVTDILQAAAIDVHGLKDQHLAASKEIREILSAPSIDRGRLEAARASELQLADQASKRFFQGIADAAEVLTPEQRAELLQKMEKRHKH